MQDTSISSIPKTDSWKMFDRIAPRYDFLNHLLSFGLDISWRGQLNRFLPARPALSLLDLATGTGDVVLTLVKHNKNITRACGLDLSDAMLALARQKVKRANLNNTISLQHGDAACIPHAEAAFDAVTIAFGIRNTADPLIVLKEMYRVLNNGGRALILEFSLPGNPFTRALHLFYLRNIIPVVGGIVSGDREAYRYLNRTIEEFPCGDNFCRIMRKAGFKNLKANTLFPGIATIYQGEK